MKIRFCIAAVLLMGAAVGFQACNEGEKVTVVDPGNDNKGDNSDDNKGDDNTGDNGDDKPQDAKAKKYVETFEGYDGKIGDGAYLAEESFTSAATGVTWTLAFGKIDQSADYMKFDYSSCFTMGGKAGKEDDGQSTITTSVLQDGISFLRFSYVANADKVLCVDVLVDGSVVWSSGEETLTQNSVDGDLIEVRYDMSAAKITENAVLRFTNVSKARRIAIGNISWNNGYCKSEDDGGSGDNGGNGGDEATNTLTGDVVLSLDDCYVANDGDYYGSDTTDFYVELYDSSTDMTLMLDLLGKAGATDFTGEYTIDSSLKAGTAVAGDEDAENIWGCWVYMLAYDADYEEFYATDPMGALTSGKISVTRNGSAYTFSIDAKAGAYKVTGNYSGEITSEDALTASLASCKRMKLHRIK